MTRTPSSDDTQSLETQRRKVNLVNHVQRVASEVNSIKEALENAQFGGSERSEGDSFENLFAHVGKLKKGLLNTQKEMESLDDQSPSTDNVESLRAALKKRVNDVTEESLVKEKASKRIRSKDLLNWKFQLALLLFCMLGLYIFSTMFRSLTNQVVRLYVFEERIEDLLQEQKEAHKAGKALPLIPPYLKNRSSANTAHVKQEL